MENENGQEVNNENLGSIDNTLVRNSVIQILEGGDVAFKMRKISMVFDMLLHSLTNQCYTLDNENKYSLIDQSPLLRVVRDFVGVAICHLLIICCVY